MAQADGTILIDTEINADGMKAGSKEVEESVRKMADSVNNLGTKAKAALNKQVASLSKLNQEYAAQAKKVDDLKKKVAEYSNQKIPTQEYREIQAQIEQAEKRLNSLISAQEKFIALGGSENSKTYKRYQYDIDELRNTIKYARGELQELEKTGKAFTFGTQTKQAAADMEKLASAERQLADLNNRLGNSYSSIKGRISEYNKLLLRSDSSQKKATKSGNRFSKSLNRTGKSANNANMGIGRMLASSILFSSVFSAISLVTSGIGEGIQNLAQYSDEFNQNMSMLMSALTRLKNAFATAFAPILDVVAPILTSLINLLADAITYVAAFFSALTGKDTFTKAKKVQQDYAESLQDTADSTKEAAKEAEKYLSPLDDINKFTEKDKYKSNKGESGSGGLSPGDMFETVKIPDSIKNMADEVGKKLAGIFDVFKKAWDNKGQPVIDSARGALNSLKTAASSVGSTFYEVFTNGTGLTWVESLLNLLRSMLDVVRSIAEAFTNAWNSGAGFENVTALFNMFTNINNLLASIGDSFVRVFSNGTGVAIWTNILQIITGIYNTIGNIAGQINKAWNTAGIGDGIWQGILNIVNSVLSFINRIVTATANWAGNLNFVPLLSSIKNLLNSISPVVDTIGNFLGNIYEKIILPMATKLIENVLPALINGISGIFNFLSEHQWIIEAVGAALIGAFVTSKVASAISTIKTVATGLYTVFESGGLLGVIKKLVPGISGITSVLGGPLTLAITAAIAAGVLLITHWDDVKAAAKKVAEWIGDKWDAIKKKTGEIWGNVTETAGTAWDNLKSWASTKFENIKSSVVTAWNTAKEKTSTTWDNIKKSVFTTWENLKTGASEKFESIKGSVSTAWSDAKTTSSNTWRDIKSTLETTWSNLKNTSKTTFDDIKSKIIDTWKNTKKKTGEYWGEILDKVKAPVNGIIGAINGMIRGVVSGINSVIKALNKINFTIPDWVPAFGGKSFGFNISTISAPQIPYLASGAVIPPNKEFLAVLGDQKQGNNIEAPESLIRRIVREESGSSRGNTYEVNAKVGRKELFRIVIDEAKMQRTQTGRNPFELA
jgi:phage-related protein